jgi:putative chitinase
LAGACTEYEINTPIRLAAFLAQIGHESGSLRHTTEIWGPTPAQRTYEGRASLGNTEAGDGERYKGHGLIQTTGRFNHRAVRDRLRARGIDCPDFEAEPDRLAEPAWAAWSAADYWDWRDCNALADTGAFEAITVKINGGLNGQSDRLERWAKAKAALGSMAEDSVSDDAPPPVRPSRPPLREDQDPYTTPTEEEEPVVSSSNETLSNVVNSPATKFLLAAVNPLLAVVPEIAKIFMDKKGTTVPERNVAAAVKLVETAQKALQKDATAQPNAQSVAEAVTNDPVAREKVRQAILMDPYWHTVEAGSGGMAAARKADVDMVALGGPWWQIFRSPSFWALLLMLPLVYLIVLSIIGAVGNVEWSPDVRAAIAGTIVGSIIGGAVGYYWGQTTSRNRQQEPN